jgi:DNA-directed RNA polymerase specialized sigma24 family protein
MEVTRGWDLNSSSFECLLRALAPDRERAAAEYEALRARLIKFFEWRACADAAELADRTLDRLAQKLEAGTKVDQIYSYCCSIARLLILEAQRDREQQAAAIVQLPLASPSPAATAVFEALQKCLARLPERSRRLVLSYYEEDRLAKVEHRKNLSLSLGVPLNALRLRAFRVRNWLAKCVRESMEVAR